MEARLGPTSESERIAALDVLRGFALLGILLVNIGAFSMPAAAYFNPTAYGDLSGLNGWVWGITHLLADLKFMAIFSMLFGAGIVLMSQRSEARGQSASGVHVRRMAWLVVFGLLHAHLLWYGDILYWYGLCGLGVFLLRRLRPRWLIVWGVGFLAVASALMLGAGLTTEQWPPEALELVTRDLDPPPEVTAAEIASYRGDWVQQMEKRVPSALEMETTTFVAWAAWRVSGLMLLGMALFKLGIVSAKRSRRFYWSTIAVAMAIGLPVVGFGIYRNIAIDWKAPDFFFLGLQYNYWGSLLVSLGWISAVMIWCQGARALRLRRRLAAVGRTAFSNYILQTVICTFIFYGHGLGLFGRVDRLGQLLIVLAVWMLQLVVSPVWLRHFAFGPLEWVWRTLMYLRRPPFRRREDQALQAAV